MCALDYYYINYCYFIHIAKNTGIQTLYLLRSS